ncbi:MAG: tetratricopeptide repeat protein [Phycisphaerae bacterium]|jgi:tetratricopeptide (TPR) repeat protein
MGRIKYLLFLILPFVFAAGCINGQAVLSLNKDGSGKVSIEGLFDYPAYCSQTDADCAGAEKFFVEQIKTMVSSGGFEAWSDVNWKILDDGRCYFKGTAYFNDVNEVDFFIGSAKTGIKVEFTRRWDGKSSVELKLQDNFRLDPQIKKLPSEMFKTFSMNFVAAMPGEIENSENFQRLDNQTVMFVFSGGQWLSYLRNNTIKATLTSDGNDLFDYKTEVGRAKKDYVEILKRIETAIQKEYITKDSNSVSAVKDLSIKGQLREGLAAQEQGEFERAVKIYEYVIKNGQTDEKLSAGAAYQIGVCLVEMRRSEQAIRQFESVINKYPQSPAALKSEKMLNKIRLNESRKKAEEKAKVFVSDTIPKLYAEDVDPNTASIKIMFSEPMKKTEWFYSSFDYAHLPQAMGVPAFDSAGIEWTLPIALEAGKVYAVAVNCGDASMGIKKLQIGFQSVSGQMCEKFVLVFATLQADPNAKPVTIDDEFIERCKKAN